MKRLTVMRHADARWKNPGTDDFARPLNRRGLSGAESMAKRLLELELVPDRLLASTARRAEQTADIVARELSLSVRHVQREEGLYLASAADMLRLIQETGPRIAHLMVIGHNPGASDLIHLLVPRGGISTLTTAAVCSMVFDTDHWHAIGPDCVKEVHHQAPPSRLFGLLR
ncbi:MAG TPA: histidine phosphatase family protein [Steroidobacteraceae bacterium]|nr:histidine phosphatase family protein [Steroidobacteraceae bacterium]